LRITFRHARVWRAKKARLSKSEGPRNLFPALRILQANQLSRLRILLADDHRNFLKEVETLLEPSCQIVGLLPNGRALVDAAVRLKPDVIVTDISMPILNGIEAAHQLNESGCKAKIIFLTVHSDPDFVRACMATGALGYVVKSRIATDLLPAIRQALANHIFVSPQITHGPES
jgi:DNA-binding NarL/FixJ family response regulator